MSPDANPAGSADGPLVAVDLSSRSPTDDPDVWNMAWTVHNRAGAPLRILGAWLPHGRFRSPRRDLDPPVELGDGDAVELRFPVRCHEEPRTVVENCFVILNVLWNDTEWQVFARVTVTFDASSAPQPRTVLVTTQRSGFTA